METVALIRELEGKHLAVGTSSQLCLIDGIGALTGQGTGDDNLDNGGTVYFLATPLGKMGSHMGLLTFTQTFNLQKRPIRNVSAPDGWYFPIAGLEYINYNEYTFEPLPREVLSCNPCS
jgi:hypothetical protein